MPLTDFFGSVMRAEITPRGAESEKTCNVPRKSKSESNPPVEGFIELPSDNSTLSVCYSFGQLWYLIY